MYNYINQVKPFANLIVGGAIGMAATGALLGVFNQRRSALSGAIQPFTSGFTGAMGGGLIGAGLGAASAWYSRSSIWNKAGMWGLGGMALGGAFGMLRGYYRAGFTPQRRG